MAIEHYTAVSAPLNKKVMCDFDSFIDPQTRLKRIEAANRSNAPE